MRYDAGQADRAEDPSVQLLRVSDASPRPYQRHEPESTVLYRVVADNLETFLAEARERHDNGLPKYVEKELRDYLACGILSRGYVLGICSACGRQLFVPLSCKKRVCPSCNARRMYNGAAHLVDHVIPDVPVRQYVLSVPFELRLLLAQRADAFTALTHIFIHQVFRWQRERAREAGLKRVQCGAVAAHHRGGSSMNLHPHVHAVLPDGVFQRAEGTHRAEFQRLPAPHGNDLVDIVFDIHQLFLRWLERHHLLRTRREEHVSNEAAERSALEACAEGALGLGGLITVRHPDRQVQHDATAQEFEYRAGSHRVGECEGYSLYAGDVISEGNPQARERLLRYCLRPPLSLERLSLRADGNVVYQVKATRHGKATERVMTPMQFMSRPVALIPPPRRPLWRYFGVFGPHCASRGCVVPAYGNPETTDGAERKHEHDATGRQGSGEASRRDGSTATTQAASATSNVQQPAADGSTACAARAGTAASAAAGNAVEPRKDRPRFSAPWRIDWATLLKRVWDIDALACPCGGRLKLVRLVTDEGEAREALCKAGLPANPPPVARARSPTFFDEPPPDWD
ncbi:MAG: transposase [Polyangiaceae bacterium]|nr:transposase [Polyangiaceae bacterium]